LSRERGTAAAAEVEIMASTVDIDSDEDPDDTLILLFMCYHRALTSSSAIALTLRAVGGLTTAEIAKAFLVPEATMAQPISCRKVNHQDFRRVIPPHSPQERAEPLPAVIHLLCPIVNATPAASVRTCSDSIWRASRSG
jgi:predicted RNA polymerase sigma factor